MELFTSPIRGQLFHNASSDATARNCRTNGDWLSVFGENISFATLNKFICMIATSLYVHGTEIDIPYGMNACVLTDHLIQSFPIGRVVSELSRRCKDEPSPWVRSRGSTQDKSHDACKCEAGGAVYDVETSQPEHHLLKVEADHIAKKVAVFGEAKKADSTS